MTGIFFPLLASAEVSRSRHLEGEARPIPTHEARKVEVESYEHLYEEPDGLPVPGAEGIRALPSDVTTPLSLDMCLRLAMARNREILSARQGVRGAYWRAQEAHRGGIPAVDYEYRVAPVPRNVDEALSSFFSGDISVFNSFELKLGAPLWTFGQIEMAQELGDLGIFDAESKREETAQDVAYKVYKLYYGLLLGHEMESLLSDAVSRLKENIDKEEKKESFDQVEILKAKAINLDLETRLLSARHKQELAKRALRIQIGYSEHAPIRFHIGPLEPLPDEMDTLKEDLETVATSGLKRMRLETGIEAKKTAYELEWRKLAPKFGWGGFFEVGQAPGIHGEGDDSSFSRPFNYKKAGFGFQLGGTFDWASARSKIHKAEAEYYQALLMKQPAIDGISLEVKEAELDFMERRDGLAKLDEARRLARQMIFLTRTNLDIGVGERKEYTDSLQAYLLAQARYYEGVYQYNIALIKLKQVASAMDDTLRGVGANAEKWRKDLNPTPDSW